MNGALGAVGSTDGDLEPMPDLAADVFGDRLDRAVDYARLLGTDAVVRGLVGPREASRIWTRHVLNAATLATVTPAEATVVDVGSGAGLPGIPLWLARPDLRMRLVEPQLRRVRFLRDVVAALDLSVEIVHARAESVPPGQADVAVARACAPLERLIPMALPLLRPGGTLLALKGAQAGTDISDAAPVLRSWPGAQVRQMTAGWESMTAIVVRVSLPAEGERR